MTLGNKTLDDLLGPISKQLEHDGVAEKVELPEWEFKAKRLTDGKSPGELVDMFIEEAGKIHIDAHRCKAADLATCLASIVGAGAPDTGEAASVVIAGDGRFAACGLADALKAQGLVSEVTVWNGAAGQGNVDAAYVATYGITYAESGIAETATVVQPTSATCGRAISLLPLVHIAVVNAADIVPTMAEVMQRYEGEKLPSQVCFISGPSATADIELVRVEGVHGPMYVHYVVVE